MQIAHREPAHETRLYDGRTGTALLERPVPYDLPAEEAVLGSLLLDRDAIIKVAPFLPPGDFYREAHGWVYQCILDLYQRREPPDLVTLSSELDRRGKLDAVGGMEFLAKVMHRVPTAVHVEYYGRIVARNAFLRRLITVGGQIAGLGYEEGQELDEVRDRAEALLFGVTDRRGGAALRAIKQILALLFDQLQPGAAPASGVAGVPSGFTELDQLTGGWQPGDLILVGARPSVGKTSFGLSAAYHAALGDGQKIAVFSMEMSAEQIGRRLLAIASAIPDKAVRSGQLNDQEWTQVAESFGHLAETDLYVDDTRGLTVADVRSRVRRLMAEVGCDLIVLDYLQLMHGRPRHGDPNRVQEVGEISRGLKELAGELNVPVLAMCQLSRAVEERAVKVPVLSDLRESGDLEQDADIVMFIYRDELYNPETNRRGIAEIHIAKHRNGPIGVVPLAFHASTTYFSDLTPEVAARFRLTH